MTEAVRPPWSDHEVTAGLLDAVGILACVVDESGRLVWWNEQVAETTGYAAEDFAATGALELVASADRDRLTEAVGAVLGGDVRTVTLGVATADGERIPHEFTVAPLPGADGEVRAVAAVGREVGDRERRERRLAKLHEATRELMGATTTAAVCEVAARTARTVLDLPFTGIWLHDEGADELRPMGATDRARDLFGEIPTFAAGEGLAWEVFAAGETRLYDDVRAEPNVYNPETPVRSELLVPIGDHGVLATASTEVGAFDEGDVYAARILAANTEAALERAEREQLLERRRDALEALNRVNELVGEIIRVLTGATTRAEIEETVCERLAASEFYRDAAVYERTADGGVRPRARAGRDDDYRSCIVVPLAHGETDYGALVVNATREDAFGERERAAFAVLGETVGFAIEAVQNRKLLFANTVTELEFRLAHRNSFFVNASGDLSCRCRLRWAVPVDDGLLQYVVVEEFDAPKDLLDRARAEPAVEAIRLVSEAPEECLFEAVLSSRSVFKRLVDAGAQPVRAVAEDGTAHITAEAPHGADVREIVDAARQVAPDVELVAKREVERPVRTARELHRDIEQRLTEKQRTALHAAYFGGYYDWPRDSTAEELADSMGISSATLHYHLRAAERELVGAFVDE